MYSLFAFLQHKIKNTTQHTKPKNMQKTISTIVKQFTEELVITTDSYYILPMFFLISYFLMVDFLIPVSHKLMDESSPKFHDW